MKYLKKIVIVLVLPYLFYSLYVDFLEYKNFYTYEEFKELEIYGEEIISRGYYSPGQWSNKCHRYKTAEGLGNLDCIQNAKMKRADIYNGSPVIYYRGQSDANKSEMCELDISLEDEGQYAGELVCYITRFKSSEADKIPLGRAVTYARKLKESKQ